MDEETRQRIATVRYGIISDFVGGACLEYGDKERLLREKVERTYDISHSNRRNVSRATILSWIHQYKTGGYQIEALYPKRRNDRGTFKSLDPELRMAIRQIYADQPTLTVPSLLRRLTQKKHIRAESDLNIATIYRFINKENLRTAHIEQEDRRKFEAESPNDLWQSDAMHGPPAYIHGVRKKTYLIIILDDNSRMIMQAAFYNSEMVENFEDALKKSVEKWGLPQKLYTDNGGCFRAHHLEFVCAALGISLRHARPYKPQGKGKVERCIRTVRQEFMPDIETKSAPMKLEELNEKLDLWVEIYNNRPHSSTEQAPINRYRKGLECIRPAPPNLLEYFREVERRLVRKDRSVVLNGRMFEVPTALIDKRVELRFHRDHPENIDVFYEGRSFGLAVLLDQNVNSKIGRDWRQNHPKSPESCGLQPMPRITGGQLF